MRERPRRTLTARWLIALFAAALLVCGLAPVRAWAEGGDNPEYDQVYVNGDTGDDESGDGTEAHPFRTLHAAENRLKSGGTIYLSSNIQESYYTFIDAKNVTIDGGGFTISRSDDFISVNDGGHGGYNPAMIEVANGSKLTLKDVTLDDGFRHEGTKYELHKDGVNIGNEELVQEGMIVAYGDGEGTIVLGSGATLKNFGGLSAVYISGEGGKGATLIMESGSKICDERLGKREGGYAAIFNHGGKVTVEAGASIESVDGRAVYIDNGGITSVNGTIKDITTNDYMIHSTDIGPSGGSIHFGGIVAYVDGNSVFTLGSAGSISDIKSYNGDSVDTLFYLNGGQLNTEEGSLISSVNVSVVDSNGGSTYLDGAVKEVHTGNVPFRLRGTQGTFELGETGSIVDCSTTDAAIIYLNGGKPTIEISGYVNNIGGTFLFVSNNGSRTDGKVTLAKSGVIENVTGDAILAGDPSIAMIEGTIRNCGGYAVNYGAQLESNLTITAGASIENNHGGGAQITVGDRNYATSALQHVEIASGTLSNSPVVSVPFGTLTLDDGYKDIHLGKASVDAVTKIQNYLKSNGSFEGWEVVPSSISEGGAKAYAGLWLKSSDSTVHFTMPRPEHALKTGLYAAILKLNDEGKPAEDATIDLIKLENAGTLDVTLNNLDANSAYAVLLVNNKEYTLAPDDITIYTGGGQGQETSDTGFPALTVADSVDPITSLVINDGEPLSDDDAMQALLDRLTVAYYDGDTQITDDRVAGEYEARLSWKDGMEPTTITINGNEVAKDFGTGTLIVRYVEDISDVVSGESTHPVQSVDPTEMQDHAVAVLDASSTYYVNGDQGNQVADNSGVSILDDSLLTNQGDNRQQLLEQRAIDSKLLPELDKGEAYRFAFRYLDLVDANNGNAWVSADNNATIYLPYPDGMTYDQVQGVEFTVVHFKGLHREYGITGPEVEPAIDACELEKIECEKTSQGIKFIVGSSGFSPFAVVWKTQAHTITAIAGEGGTITPSGSVTVAEGADQAFTITPEQGYEIADVKVDGESVGAVTSYTFTGVDADHTIEATFKSTSVTPPVTKYYEIDASAGEGGSISPSGTVRVKAGTSQSFSITPAEGYSIHAVYVDGEFCGRVSSYTFTNVQADHEISVQFKRGNDPADPGDTGVDQWFDVTNHDAFMHGYDDGTGTFGPDDNMSRAHAAQMFYNMLKDKSYGDIEISFPDVDEDEWYYEAVSVLASRGIIKGDDFTGTFRPADSISRAEFTAMAMRFSKGDYSGENIFVDVSEDAWYYDVVVGSVKYGWISGYQDGSHRFGPSDTLKRAQAATIANRMLGRVADSTWIVENLENDGLKLFPDVARDHYAFFDIVEATNSHDYEKDNGYESWTGLK